MLHTHEVERDAMQVDKAYYIKLGRGGEWEADSINSGKLRLGWRNQTVDDIVNGRWTEIGQQLLRDSAGKRGVATTDCNRLRDIAESGSEDVWVTFHAAKMWWTQMAPGQVEQDEVSKFRRTTGWSDKGGSKVLFANELPGRLAQLQAFRGTVCRVSDKDLLLRVLTGKRSPLATEVSTARAGLAAALARAIRELHWKDFETLADLVFRQAGWIRNSVLGQQVKALDLELIEPLTRSKYVVQVKSQAGVEDLIDTIESFSKENYRRVYFVVHSPTPDLRKYDQLPDHVELLLPERLGELALEAGLTQWIEAKVA
jgi:hypothetical protein